MLMFRQTILQIGYLFIPTQALHKKNSLAAVSVIMFFFFPLRQETPHLTILKPCCLITHRSFNTAFV